MRLTVCNTITKTEQLYHRYSGISEVIGVLIAWFFVVETERKWMWTGVFNIVAAFISYLGLLLPDTCKNAATLHSISLNLYIFWIEFYIFFSHIAHSVGAGANISGDANCNDTEGGYHMRTICIDFIDIRTGICTQTANLRFLVCYLGENLVSISAVCRSFHLHQLSGAFDCLRTNGRCWRYGNLLYSSMALCVKHWCMWCSYQSSQYHRRRKL